MLRPRKKKRTAKRANPRIITPELHAYQNEVLDHPAQNKIVVWGRQTGKNVTAYDALLNGHGEPMVDMETQKLTLLWRGLLTKGNILWVAPTHQMSNDDWIVIKEMLLPVVSDPKRDISEKSRTIDLINGARFRLGSGHIPNRLRGPNYHGIIFNEAAFAETEDQVWTILEPTLMVNDGWSLFTSTPNPEKGFGSWFYALYQAAQDNENWMTWQAPSSINPAVTPEKIEKIRNGPGMTKTKFMIEYEAQFLNVHGNCRFDTDALYEIQKEDCRKPTVVKALNDTTQIRIWKPPRVGQSYIAGIDMAEGVEGGDRSAIVIFNWRTLEQVASIHGNISIEPFSRAVVDIAKQYNNCMLIPERNVGSDLITHIRHLGYNKIYHHVLWGGDISDGRPGFPISRSASGGGTRPVIENTHGGAHTPTIGNLQGRKLSQRVPVLPAQIQRSLRSCTQLSRRLGIRCNARTSRTATHHA